MTRTERLERDNAHEPVLFYRPNDEWGSFSNFSKDRLTLPHPFNGRLYVYSSGEHRYQARKAKDAKSHDYVASAPRSSEAKDRGREVELRNDWGNSYGDVCWYVMLETVLTKALQNRLVYHDLLLTGRRHLYEDSPVDDIWGWRYGETYSGKNLLGRAWMQTRFMLGSAVSP